MAQPSKQKVPTSIGSGRYEIGKKLGAGCFGEVYKGVNQQTKEEVAVKFEDISSHSGTIQLETEARILDALRKPTQPQGFAQLFWNGKEGDVYCLVMECLGKSLEDRVQGCNGSLNVKTTVLVADQVLRRIEYLHSKGIVHRDIKPENFMWGVREKQHHLYLIDFGLSRKYYDKKHCPEKHSLSLTGTARYASLNAHRGIEQSRRDDLEAIGHMLIYFLRGSLPWSGLEARNKQEKYKKIKEKKESTLLSKLCEGYPDAFMVYLSYSRGLAFKDRPDYNEMRKIFLELRSQLASNEGPIEDYDFQWNQGKELPCLVALEAPPIIPQPDDHEAMSRFCFCGSIGVHD